MISKRVQGFTESVIREMTRVNNQYEGINLAQGMPNFPPPRELVEAAHRAIDGDFHQYAITWGTPRLRQAIADKYRKFYRMDVEADRHVTVCCGSTETMLATLLAVLNPGDEVIIFEPFYENYGPGCIIAGAEPVFVPLEPPDFSFDPDRLARAVTSRTRAVVFNSPNNPSGKVFSRAELQVIADLCLKHDLLAITDEIYEHIVFDGLGHTPIATLPGMTDRTVTISGISKSYSVTGWRVGYAVASPELSLGIRRAHDFITVGAPHPLQEAAVPRSACPTPTTCTSGRAIRLAAICCSARWKRRASSPSSPVGPTTSSPRPRTSWSATAAVTTTSSRCTWSARSGWPPCPARPSTPTASSAGPRSASASRRRTTC